MNIIPHIFYPLTLGLVIFTIAFFKWPKYAIASLIIAKPIIDVTWDYSIILDINFLKLYAGLFVLLGIIFIIVKRIPILSLRGRSPRQSHFSFHGTSHPSFHGLTGESTSVHNSENSSASGGQFHAQHKFQPQASFQRDRVQFPSPTHRHSVSPILIMWSLFIVSTFTSVFVITGFHYLIVQLKYILSVANGFVIFILAMHVFDPEKDKGFFIKTFIIAGIFPILLWLIPIILGTQVYSNDELLRVQGPYQNFWQFAFAGLQTLIFCFAYFAFRSKNSSPFRQRRTSEGEGKGEGVSNSSAPAVTSSAKGGQFHAQHIFQRISAHPLHIIVSLCLIMSVIMLYCSYSKAFWLAGFLILVVGFILMRKYIFAILIPVIIAILFFIPPFNKDIRKTFSNEIGYYVQHSVPKQRVLRGRVEVWKQALRQYLKLPFFKRVFGMGMTHRIKDAKGIENDYLRVFVEQGFVGLLIYLGLIVSLIIVLIQNYVCVKNPVILASLLSVISLLVLSIGANPLLIPNVQWVVWSSAGFALTKR